MNPFLQGLILAGLGDKDRSFEAVERLSALGPVRIGRDLNSPEFDLIRGDPRAKLFTRRSACRNGTLVTDPAHKAETDPDRVVLLHDVVHSLNRSVAILADVFGSALH
jgi:hypothetical protein